MLAYLAMHPDRRASREHLATFFWGDRREEHARQSLRQCLLSLRRDLAKAPVEILVVDSNTVGLQTSNLTIDAAELMALAESSEMSDIEHAASLYRGEFLSEFNLGEPFDGWVRKTRSQLDSAAANVFQTCATLAEARGDGKQAIRAVERLIALDALREDIRKRLLVAAEARAREQVQRSLLDRLVAMHEFPLPAVLVNNEIESLVADAKGYMQRIGRPWEEYLAAKEVDEDGLRTEYRVEAERRVRTSLLLEEIAKAEAIEVTTSDLEAELAQLARSYGLSRDSLIQMIRKNTGFGPLIDSVRKQKTIDHLIAHATIVDAPAAMAGR